jgi:hypothetical protein
MADAKEALYEVIDTLRQTRTRPCVFVQACWPLWALVWQTHAVCAAVAGSGARKRTKTPTTFVTKQ